MLGYRDQLARIGYAVGSPAQHQPQRFREGEENYDERISKAGRPVALTPGNRAEFSISIDLHPFIDSG